MDENLDNNQSLIDRIQQLEHERNELHRDIEQLCMQQAGTSYLGVATRMHFQRTAGLEQEIENLKKQLAACKRENLNLQEELSEAYHIKTQLAALHNAEVLKNVEAEKQVKFFQTCVAATFAERDNAIVEAEKAKEKEELMSLECNELQKRVEELTSALLEEKKLTARMKSDQDTWERQIEAFKKVVDKFYAIKKQTQIASEGPSWEDKCESLLDDSAEMWTFSSQEEEASISNYVSALEHKVETLRKSMDNLQNNLRMGLEIENHLQQKVCHLEKEKFLLQEKLEEEISGLHDYHRKHRIDIINLLDEYYSFLKLTISKVEERVEQLELSCKQNLETPKIEEDMDSGQDNNECRDVHVNSYSDINSTAMGGDSGLTTTITEATADASQALAQALQEKVAALLLLSQEEERHLLERNLHVALQRKFEELRRNLLRVTNEKVKALMELAQLKQEYQALRQKTSQGIGEGNSHAATREKGNMQEGDGRLKNLLKKTYLRHWVGNIDSERYNAEAYLNYEGNSSQKQQNYKMDFARMKIENAALKESLENMEHLKSSVRRLRLALLKIQESATLEGVNNSLTEAVEDIINEATLVKTAIGSSLPISWSSEADLAFNVDHVEEALDVNHADPGNEKGDFVSAAGYEMVELLIFAAHTWKEYLTKRG